MKTITIRSVGAVLVALISPAICFAQSGNDNPSGVAGSFNGTVTTGGSYDPYTGNATRSVTDLVVAGAVGSYPLAFTRTSNSRYTPGLPVEFAEPGGWRHSYQWSIDSQFIQSRGTAKPMPGSYTINFPDGRREIFRFSDSDIYMRASPGIRERFQKAAGSDGGNCYLILPDGGKIWFRMNVQRDYPPEDGAQATISTFDFELLGIIDPHGLVTTVTHPGDGSRQITDPTGRRWLKLFYGKSSIGRGEVVLDHVTASDGRTVEYSYWEYTTSTGAKFSALSNVFYNVPSPEWATYSYQDDNIDPDGRPLLRTCNDPMFPGPMWQIGYTFAPKGPGVVAGQLQSENHSPALNSVGNPVSTLTSEVNSPNTRTETRGDGPARIFTYSGGLLAGSTDFKNVSASQSYDSAGFVSSATDRNGNKTEYLCDPLSGNVKKTTFPLTPPDSQRATVQVTYGNPSCPDTNNRDGNNPYHVCTMTNERGFATKYFRDANKRAIRIEYPDGGFETFTYNRFGQVLNHQMTSGGIERFEYDDSNGRLLAYRDPYHASGNPTARYQYDNRGRASGVTDMRGTSAGDPNYTTNYEYDFRGQITKITHPIEPGTTFRYFVQNEYNPNGTLKARTDERGFTTEYGYDDYKRVSTITAPVAYDGDTTPRITELYYTRNGIGGVYDYSHTDANPGSVRSPGGKFVRALYDENARKRTVILGVGNEAATTTYSYDLAGNLQTVKDPAGQTTGLYAQYFYDPRNRLTDFNDQIAADRNSRNHTVSWTLDPAGNKTSELRANNQLISYDSYDPMNRLKQQTVQRDAGVADTTYMDYDHAGNLLTFQDGRGQIYYHGSDYMSRRTSVVYPDSTSEWHHYDQANNMDTYTDRSGAVQTFEYDNRNRETHYWWNSWPHDTLHEWWLAYDEASNLRRVRTQGEDGSTFIYDGRNRKISDMQTTPANLSWTINYTYDADSNRRTMTYPSGYEITYAYNSRNQLRSESDAAGAVVTYDYYPNDLNLKTRTLRNGTTTNYVPDALNRARSVEHKHGTAPMGRFDYNYDKVGRIDWMKRDSSRGDRYDYFLDDQLKSAAFDASNPASSSSGATNITSLVYDSNGNRTSQTNSTSPDYNYVVNELNQYTSVNSATPDYSAAGNLMHYNGWAYDYTRQNQLTDVVSATSTTYFYYEGLGRQVLRDDNGTWTYSVWDGWNLIAEYDYFSGDLIRSYVHGGATDEMVARFDPGANPNRIWYYQDGQGSTTHLADDAGTVVEKYKYEPAFSGAPSIYAGNGAPRTNSFYNNRFLYTGREYYEQGGVYDYRNRAYLPSLGRFMQPDPIGFAGDPTNLYRYCGGDPVNETDSSGQGGVRVTVNGNNVGIQIPINYSGPFGAGVPAGAISTFNSGISSTWSGPFGQWNVQTSVVNGGSFGNNITVYSGSGTSGTEVGGPSGHWFAGGSNGSNGAYVAAHEAGHLMGLPDRSVVVNGFRLVQPGYTGNIMAGFNGTPTAADISNIIQANTSFLGRVWNSIANFFSGNANLGNYPTLVVAGYSQTIPSSGNWIYGRNDAPAGSIVGHINGRDIVAGGTFPGYGPYGSLTQAAANWEASWGNGGWLALQKRLH